MRKPTSLALCSVVALVMTLLLPAFILLPSDSAAQPAPHNPCPSGQVYDSGQAACVPYVVPTEVVPTVDPAADEPSEDRSPEEVAEDAYNMDLGGILGLTLRHYACDAGFDPRQDAVNRESACTGASKPAFSYDITARGREVADVTLQTGDGAPGEARVIPTQMKPILAGNMVIAVNPVEGWGTSWVTCTIYRYTGSHKSLEPEVTGGMISLSLDVGDHASCAWFNVQGLKDERDQGSDNGNGGTSADITISTYSCPAGATASDDLAATCGERVSGLAFSLMTETETVANQASDAEGKVYFADVAPDTYGIAAVLPVGYGEPIVICQESAASRASTESEKPIVFGNQFRLIVGEGGTADCAWYNVPTTGSDYGPNIYVQAWACDSGTEITSSMTVFDAEKVCPGAYTGKAFDILLGDEVIATKSTISDGISNGQVFFTKLLAPNGGGVYGVRANLADRDKTLAVYCDLDFGSDVFHTIPVTVSDGNRIDQVLYEGHTMRCSWFIDGNPNPTPEPKTNVDPGIKIITRLCPPEVVTEKVDLAVVCSVPAPGITFDVAVGGEPSSTQTVGESGELAVPLEVGPSTYQIANQQQTGYSEPSIACAVTHTDGTVGDIGEPLASGSPGVQFSFDGESEVTCTFYFLVNPDELEADAPANGSAGDAVAPPEDQEAVNGGPQEEDTALVGDEGQADRGDDQGNVASAPNSLMIQFWACPEGTGTASSEDALEQACSPTTDEQSVMLTIDGAVIGDSVASSGSWDFREDTIVADIGPDRTTSVWCTSTWSEEGDASDGSEDTVSLNGGELSITVTHPGTAVICNWFLFAN